MTADLNLAVRQFIQAVMGMPANSVRPANQIAPAGGQTDEIATVLIMHSADDGIPGVTYGLDDNEQNIEIVDSSKIAVASIHFFRGPKKNAIGAAAFNTAAVDRAARLGQLLRKSSSVELLQQLGLGVLQVGRARDLSAIADTTWESRGQIDVTFNAINRETSPVGVIESVDLAITVQPGPTTTSTIEVIL